MDTLNRSVLESVLLGELDLAGKTGLHPYTPQAGLMSTLKSGKAKLVHGTPEDLRRFFSYFDPPGREPILLTIR